MKFIFILTLFIASSAFAENYTDSEVLEAFNLYMEQAQSGDLKAQLMVAESYQNGWGVPKNEKIALRWYNALIDQNYPPAIYQYGRRKLLGHDIEANENLGLSLLKKADSLDYPDASALLGAYYLGFTTNSNPKDNVLAEKYLLSGANKGNSSCMLFLGVMYLNGIEPNASLEEDIDIEKAVYWFEKSAELLNPDALGYLGFIHYDSNFKRLDYEKAYFWFRIAQLLNNSQWSGQLYDSEIKISQGARNRINQESRDWYEEHL